jgi:predicted TIM-barrel fold metal-dependent hydrolase
MIADAHIHLFRNGFWQDGTSPLGMASDLATYTALRQTFGIGHALVVGYEGERIDPDNNAYVAGLAAMHDWITPLAYLDDTATPEAATRHLEMGHRGIVLYLPDATAVAGLSRWSAEIWALLSARRALVSINARPAAIAPLAAVLSMAPEAQILFSHLGLPGPQADIAALLDLVPMGNVGVKLSGLYAIDPTPPHHAAHPVVETLLDKVPAPHLHWGSDFSPVLGALPFDATLQIPGLTALAEPDQALIMGNGLMAKIATVRTLPDKHNSRHPLAEK